jgi:ferredoxin
VDCFYEGENMIVINTEECIDCAVCEPECPIDAIVPDTDPHAEKWITLNQKYAELSPNITAKGIPPSGANDWADTPDKLTLLSENPAAS